MHNSGAFALREGELTCGRHRKQQHNPGRHSGAMRSIEPGIHNPRPWLWIPGLRQGASTMCNCTSGNDSCVCFPAVATTVIASGAKQSIFLADAPWIASLRPQ
jgi:hypothetical protein